MQYWGGKGKRARRAAMSVLRFDGPIHEVCCGALHLTPHLGRVVYASDICEPLITLLRAVQSGWTPPPTIDRPTWDAIRVDPDPMDPMTALAAFGASYGGRWFAGYAGSSYPGAARSLVQRVRPLSRVRLEVGDYTASPTGVTVCDIPFANTRSPGEGLPFDAGRFWSWAAARDDPCIVYEQQAPIGWVKIDAYDYPTHKTVRREYIWIHEKFGIH